LEALTAMSGMKRGFTLIELLIVVAIIAILAAIAVPNFLEAQTRSKVSRIKADQRTIATALEAYRVDTNKYPPHYGVGCNALTPCPALVADACLPRLTTPVAYITSIDACRDIFNDRVLTVRGPGLPGAGIVWNTDYMFYNNYSLMSKDNGANYKDFEAWAIRSVGPDHADDAEEWRMYNYACDQTNGFFIKQFLEGVYDPTNGTVSIGDICRFGGEVPPQAAQVSR
jgi:type II secretion system protein G